MKKIFFPLLAWIGCISIGYAQEFAVSNAEAAKEEHSIFIEKYRTKIEAKAVKKNIPFGITAAIMSAQAGANIQTTGYNFSKIAATSQYARVGKFVYADQQDGLMLFDRPRHNAEATVLILAGWLKNRIGVELETGIEWLNALTEEETGLFPADRLAELAVAYEAATGSFLDINELNLSEAFIEAEQQTEIASNLANENQALEKINEDLALTKEELAEKEQKLLAVEQAKATMQEELTMTKEELAMAEMETDSARRKVVKLRNEFQAHKANPNPLFRSMIDIKGGLALFKAQNTGEVSTGINVEAQYALIGNNGIGIEAGVNMIQLSEAEDFTPFISPYLGFSVGKYDNTLGFSFSPRAYYFMNPMLEITTMVEDAPMIGRVKPTVMFGAGANVKLKLGDIAAFTLYTNYMRGPFKIEEKGLLNEEVYINTTKTNLNVFGGGVGLSFRL